MNNFEVKEYDNLGETCPIENPKNLYPSIDSDSPDCISINGAIDKDEVLESLAKIFYETQMYSNDSPVTKELVEIENSASKIYETLKTDNESPSQEKITEAINDVLNLRICLEKLINNFEKIREKIYPIAEKVALIQLEKDPYKIPGDPYKRIELSDKKLNDEVPGSDEDDEEEEKFEMKSDDSGDFEDEDIYYDCNPDVYIPTCEDSVVQRGQSVWHYEKDNELPWRTTLPYLRPPKLKFSIWSIIKNAIGKDLTRFSVPVYFNEPISMTQKGGEAMEYEDLLVKANNCDDSLLRIAYISAFNASQYANLEERNLKPCNPVLGETYELLTNNFKFFSEQVSHHPPITACHAKSKDYELYMHTDVKSSFKSTSLHFTPKGSTHVILRKTEEHFVVNRPVNTVNNLILGTLYIDLTGESVAVNRNTNEKCVFRFIKRGWGSKNAYKVEGEIFDSEGNQVYEVFGHWHRSISIRHLETGEETEIWKLNPRLEQWDHLYHFSLFTLQLNYIDDKLIEKLPCTDSRFRPDQRALENGDLNLASKEKHNVEEFQRSKRKEREEAGIEWIPRYFEAMTDEVSGDTYYKFNGQYWKDRESGKVKELERVF